MLLCFEHCVTLGRPALGHALAESKRMDDGVAQRGLRDALPRARQRDQSCDRFARHDLGEQCEAAAKVA